MIKNSLFLSISTALRLLTSVVLFLILARFWGPRTFGIFIYWFTVSTLICLLVDYGFVQKTLREIGRDRSKFNEVKNNVVIAKIILSVSVLAVSLLITSFIAISFLEKKIFIALLLSSIFFSFGEYLCAPLRAINNYSKELILVVVFNTFHFITIGILVSKGGGVEEVAIGFVFTRLIYFLTSILIVRKISLGFPTSSYTLANAFYELKGGLIYSIDAILTNLYIQLDTLVIKYILGSYWLGIYQAGNRFSQGYFSLAQIINNLFVPKIAGSESDKKSLTSFFNQLVFISGLIGLTGYLFFVHVLGSLIDIIIGKEFHPLVEYLKPMGLIVFVKFLNGSLGIFFSALGHQSIRVSSTLTSCLFFFLILFFLTVSKLATLKTIIFLLVTTNVITSIVFICYFYGSNLKVEIYKLNYFFLAMASLLVFLDFYFV